MRTRWCARSRRGASGSPAGAPGPRAPSSLAEVIAVPDRAFDGAALLVSVPQGGSYERGRRRPGQGRRLGALHGPRRQPRDPLYGVDRRLAPRSRPGADVHIGRIFCGKPVPTFPENAPPGDCRMSALTRPQPRPGVLDIDAYVPGKSSAPGRRQAFSSCRRTRRRWARARRRSRPIARSPAIWRTIRTARRPTCARRSARRSGSIRTASSAAPAPTICSICSPAPIWATATRRSTPRTASWSIRSRRSAPARSRWWRRRPTYTADVDAILARVTPSTKMVFLANPNNPTGTYLPFDEVKRLHAGLPPHVLLVLDAAYAEYVRRNDYEAGIELVATSRERRDVPHVLEDPRPRRAAARLDVRAGACGRCAQPHPRAVQRQRAGDRRRHRRDRGHRARGARARAQRRAGSPG